MHDGSLLHTYTLVLYKDFCLYVTISKPRYEDAWGYAPRILVHERFIRPEPSCPMESESCAATKLEIASNVSLGGSFLFRCKTWKHNSIEAPLRTERSCWLHRYQNPIAYHKGPLSACRFCDTRSHVLGIEFSPLAMTASFGSRIVFPRRFCLPQFDRTLQYSTGYSAFRRVTWFPLDGLALALDLRPHCSCRCFGPRRSLFKAKIMNIKTFELENKARRSTTKSQIEAETKMEIGCPWIMDEQL
ncbi:hypothetical protein HYFRA_00002930 [Hymenoscyphus fraxineus]|uniref:Uncharacterized protein n=1 Tax=Hymenoscyphus fraxineus TaxID=746836 RepID=A0A9N9PFQ4_9HELO|nr:hypothetical protein HYFRA_00002930 [Hymenoscyphus fraxineus]